MSSDYWLLYPDWRRPHRDFTIYPGKYDIAGNISKITNPDGSYVTYEYDSLNQLVQEHYSTCLPLSGEVDSANAEDGLATGAPSLIWGFAGDQFAIKLGFTEMNKAMVSLAMGLTVDFGVGFSTNAIIEGHHIINSSDAVFDNHSNVLVSPSSSSFWRTYYSWTSYGLASSSNMYTSKVPCSGLVPSVASAYSVRI